MKTKYLFQVSAFLLGIVVLSGCVQWPEFESLDLDSAPTVSIALVSAADSTITVDVTSSMSGFISVILVSGTGNAVPDSSALLTENVLYDEFASGEVTANEAARITFSSVEQDSDYEVMASGANEDGMVSDVAVLAVSTTDSYGPELVSTSPGSSYGPVLDPSELLVLTFNEPVILGSGAFSFEIPFGGPTIPIPSDSVSVSGNEVSISIPGGTINGEYLWLHWTAGAVKDAAGNEAAALTTIYDADANEFVGAYWSVINVEMSVVTVAPDVAVAQAVGFDIVLTFSDDVDADGVGDGDITLSYDDGAGIVTVVDVPAADVVASGNQLTISQTVFTPAGGSVTLDIPDGLLTVYYDNPVTAISETWDIQ